MNSRSALAVSAPIAGGVITYITYRGLYIPAGINGMNVGFTAEELSVRYELPLVALQEVLGRLSWSVAGTFFVLAILGSAILLSCFIYGALRDRTSKFRHRTLTIVLVSVIAMWASWGDNPFVVKSLNPMILKALELLSMPRAEILLNVFTPLLLTVTVLLIAAAWATLLGKPATGETPESLKDQIRKLNTTLFVGATMIVAGIVYADAMHLLPAALLDDARAAIWNQLVDGLSASMGAVWTLMLLGIYLPCIAILRMRAREMALNTEEGELSHDVDKWQTKHGLNPRFRDSLVQIVALLSPLIIGGPAAPYLRLLAG